MEKVRFGIIGVGNMGSLHFGYLTRGEIEGAVVTAACDIKPGRLEWAKSVNPDVAVFEDYHDLLNSGLVDAVLIAVPHYLHPIIGMDAFDAGVSVLTENPDGVFTENIYDFMAKAKEAEEKGLTFGIMFNQRTVPHYKAIHDLVHSGKIGKPIRLNWIVTNWYRTQDYYNSGEWRATYSGEGGGVLLNQCPHQLDMWQWIFGVPDRIRAFAKTGKYHDIEVEDEVTAYAEYDNGATAVFVTTTGEYPGTNRLEISGTKGRIICENDKYTVTTLSDDVFEYTKLANDDYHENVRTDEEFEGTPWGGHETITQNFTDHILKGTPLIAPGEDGIKSLSMSNAMMLSSWTDKEVSLPNDGKEYHEILKDKIAHSRRKENVTEKVSDLSGTFNT